MTKYTTKVGGRIVGLVQGDGARITMDGNEITDRRTTENCPRLCGAKATCEHGVHINGRLVHIWDCPRCGYHEAIPGYGCPNCG